jgi:hypothetical protein
LRRVLVAQGGSVDSGEEESADHKGLLSWSIPYDDQNYMNCFLIFGKSDSLSSLILFGFRAAYFPLFLFRDLLIFDVVGSYLFVE